MPVPARVPRFLLVIALTLPSVALLSAAADDASAESPRDVRAASRAVAPDATPQVAAVAEAARTGRHGARLNPLDPGEPFAAQRWADDPAYRRRWLDEAAPGRAFQTAPPAVDGVALRRQGEPAPAVRHGKPVALAVVARPGDPVSFTATMGGVFTESETNAVTVQADDQGLAIVHYVAYVGVFGDAAVIAGSPRCIGQVTFMPHVVEEAQP